LSKRSLYLWTLLGTAAVAAMVDWMRALFVPGLSGWAATTAYFVLVKLTGDLIRGLAASRPGGTAFYADRLGELVFFALLGVVAAVAIDITGKLLGARANPAAVAVVAHLGILMLGGDGR